MLAVFCSPLPSRKGGEGDRSSRGTPPAPFPACQENRSGLWRFSWQAGKTDLIFCVRPNPLTPFPKWEGGIYQRERLSYPFVKIFVGRHTSLGSLCLPCWFSAFVNRGCRV